MTVLVGTMQLPVPQDADQVRAYLNGTIADGGLWTGLTRASDHDHTGGLNGKPISVASIPDGSITSSKLDPAVLLPYALVDGSKPFTGQVALNGNAIIRDTLYFGAKPAGAADVTVARTGAGALRVDNNLGVGVAPENWNSVYRVVRIGRAGSVHATTNADGIGLGANSQANAAGNSVPITPNIVGGWLTMGAAGLYYYTIPAVGAGVTQTFQQRLLIDPNGIAIHTPAAGAGPGVVVDQPGSGLQHVLQFRRAGAGVWSQMLGASNELQWWEQALGAYRMSLSQNGILTIAPSVGQAAIDARGNISISPSSGEGGMFINTPAAGNANFVFQRVGVSRQGIFASENGVVFNDYGRGTVWMNYSTNNYLTIDPGGPIFGPARDNAISCGHSTGRWTAVYAVAGSINTSHVSMKRDFAPLDPAACVAAVAETDWLSFTYNPPAPPERGEDMDDKAWSVQQENYQKALAETAPARRSKGYVLGSEEYHTADLFGTIDRTSGQVTADLAVVACALQDALKRIAALEAIEGAPN